METPPATDLHRLVEELSGRIERLEAELAAIREPGPAPAGRAPAAANGTAAVAEIPPDVVLAISAAVAAFLGKKATVKQVRLVRGTTPWAAAGRADVQTSHRIASGPW